MVWILPSHADDLCCREQVDMNFVFFLMCFIALSWHILSGVPFLWTNRPCHFDKAGVSHILHLSVIFVSTSWHRVEILLALD